MKPTVFTDQQERLIEITYRQLHAIKIGDIPSVETHIDEAKEVVAEIKFKWTQHRAEAFTLDNAPTDTESSGASSKCRVVVVRPGYGLLGDDGKPSDDAMLGDDGEMVI